MKSNVSFSVSSCGMVVTSVDYNGRTISPFKIAPWGETGDENVLSLPPILHKLRGDWVCAPFGASRKVENLSETWTSKSLVYDQSESNHPHGYSSNADWSFNQEDNELHMECIYPKDHPIAKVKKTLKPTQNGYIGEVEIHPRVDISLPIGLHPTFRLSSQPGKTKLIPGKFKFGMTFPGSLEKSSTFVPAQIFDNLSQIRTIHNTVVDASSLPLNYDTEELIQLCGIDGHFTLINEEENYEVKLQWDPQAFPSVLLWMSNRGRPFYPWNGNFTAVGIEPINAAFDLGNYVSVKLNYISRELVDTCANFKEGEVWTTRYEIQVRGL